MSSIIHFFKDFSQLEIKFFFPMFSEVQNKKGEDFSRDVGTKKFILKVEDHKKEQAKQKHANV